MILSLKVKIILNELSRNTNIVPKQVSEEILHPNSEKQHTPVTEQQPLLLRYSEKTIKRPTRYMLVGESFQVVLVGESFQVVSKKHEIDPIIYDEVGTDVDADYWHKAMTSKIDSTFFNKVWELVEILEGIKPIGYKWVYKMETFKASLLRNGTLRERVSIMRRLFCQ